MKYIFLLLIIACASTSQAQFFSTEKHPAQRQYKPGAKFNAKVNGDDSIYNVIRPTTSAAIEIPSFRAMTGAGISFQHTDYNYATQKFKVIWSVSFLGWIGGTIPPPTQPGNPLPVPDPNTFVSYGVQVGILNDNITAGFSINHSKPQANFGWHYNFNN